MKKIIISVFALIAITACKKEPNAPTPPTTIEIPTKYEFSRNGASTVSYGGQKTRIDMHSAIKAYAGKANSEEINAITLQKMIENSGNPFTTNGAFYTAAEMNASGKKIWNKLSGSSANSGNQDKAHDYFKGLFNQLEELSKVRTTEAAKGVAGLAGGKRLVDAKGFEAVQVLSKSIMGALELDQIVNHYLSDAKLNVENDKVKDGANYTEMEHHWDEAFGYTGLPTDPNLDYSEKGTDAANKYRRFWAGYLNSISSSVAGKDMKQHIYNAFLAGRTAIVNKDVVERNKQREIIKNLMSKACAIRTVHYLVEAANEIAKNPGAVHAGAFHEGSEGIGFLYGLSYMSQSHPKYSKVNSIVNESLQAINEKGFYHETISDTLLETAQKIATEFGFQPNDA